MKLTFAVQRYVEEGGRRGSFAPTTVKVYRRDLRQFCDEVGNVEVTALTRKDVARWFGSLRCSAVSTRQRLHRLQGFTRWLVANGYRRDDPAAGFVGPRPPRRVPRRLDAGSVGQVIAACDSERSALIVILMVQLGLRCCEVSRLQVGDLDLREELVMIRGKGSKERVVPLSEEALEAIKDYLSVMPLQRGPLLRSLVRPAEGLGPNYIGALVRQALYTSGVKERAFDGKSPHLFRHVAATDMLRGGADVRQVQVVLGHESLRTTQEYLAWEVTGLRSAVAGRRYRPTSTIRPTSTARPVAQRSLPFG